MGCSTRGAIAYGSIPNLVLSDARHEAIQALIRTDDSGLENRWDSAAAKFEPGDSRLLVFRRPGTDQNGSTPQEGFVGTEVSVREPPHDPVPDRIDVIVHPKTVERRLRNAECVGYICGVVATWRVSGHGQR